MWGVAVAVGDDAAADIAGSDVDVDHIVAAAAVVAVTG